MCACRCGHRAYAGYVAEADALSARTGWLVERIAAGDPAPDPVLAVQYAVWSPPTAAGGAAAAPPGTYGQPHAPLPVPGPSPRPDQRSAAGVGTLLLSLGAMLLVVAGAVFAAVVWDRLGAWGQVGFMLAATFGIGALAIRLRRALPGTAEALAVVAAGLAAVDIVAAPLLGLLPTSWVADPTAYPAIALTLLGLGLLGLHHRFELGAWKWLGWADLLAGAWLVVPAVATVTEDLASSNWIPAALVVPTLVSVGMLGADQYLGRRWATHKAALQTVGAAGLTLSTLVTGIAALSPDHRVGALITTALTATVVGVWAVHDGGRTRLLTLGAAALAGITVALVLALPPDPQPLWLAAAVALAGFAVGLVMWVAGTEREELVIGAGAAWLAWAALRVTAEPAVGTPTGLVTDQLCVLTSLVACLALVLAWWTPGLAWAGAALGTAALFLAPIRWSATLVDTPERYTLPIALLFLVAGLLWRRSGAIPSTQWLGPAVTIALIPSAAATWLAPWALDLSVESTATHLLRLGALLVASVVLVVTGARLRLAGLLFPATTALVILAGAQVWSGLSMLPRWTALAIAGTLLVVAGARLEWLVGQGRRAVGWADTLR